ncbi:MAG TPA: fumarylacetoacetate hydrolase family protein [Chitinophagales bacterium]|jgi:acylpyruvate hydrolase|nr:fumarylacetoacetate hydrolase family protein [Chitinophagales bacterium]MBP6153661.1 fumarylacetoacetate hydrolase family protein [Chitinophagales bacterium]HQV79090.1 fumarylacetoacetate hydrolase family protein [Chitinophagales bacterium]HQW79786.1 fumarylacetoacetate hydrolase family protein [Chitinophagales bacterium]
MKIFCVGLNYNEHIKEMKHFSFPESPVIFMKPPTALLKNGQPFYYPDISKEVHYEGEIVLRVCKNGKKIDRKFAHKYYDAFTLGFDFTARDLQADLKKKGWPWEIAKGFDGSAFIGDFIPLEHNKKISFTIKKNNEIVQQGDTTMLIFSFDEIIAYISQYFTLQQGDLIYTGTPQGVGAVGIGDLLEGFVGDTTLVRCEIK